MVPQSKRMRKWREARRETPKFDLVLLVGGLRISLGDDSTTPGPRAHVLGFLSGAAACGLTTRLFVASETPLLRRFARIREGAGGSRSRPAQLAGDVVRLLAALTAGMSMRHKLRGVDAAVVYERIAVMQHLSVFFPKNPRATRVVESNGIMSRETSQDRQALALVRLAEAIERRAYRSADLVVCVSDALAREVAAFSGVQRDRIVVIRNAIPDEVMRLRRSRDDGRLIIGFAGAVVAWQQLDVLIRAVATVNHTRASPLYPIEVEIIGDGPCRTEIEALTRELGLQHHVRLFGSMSREATYAQMVNWDAGFAGHKPSSSKAMYHSPLKVYEYAGCGVPVIATESEDLRGLVYHGYEARLFSTELELGGVLAQFAVDTPRWREDPPWRAKLSITDSWAARVAQLQQVLVERGTHARA